MHGLFRGRVSFVFPVPDCIPLYIKSPWDGFSSRRARNQTLRSPVFGSNATTTIITYNRV